MRRPRLSFATKNSRNAETAWSGANTQNVMLGPYAVAMSPLMGGEIVAPNSAKVRRSAWSWPFAWSGTMSYV